MKILIADDDPQLVRALRITLATQGYDVVAARDGADAIALATKEHPDLVLLDLGMPRVDGMSVIQALRGWTTAPIIVVSGRTGSGDKVDALDAGADDYLTKPFLIDELLARLRAHARRSVTVASEPIVSFGDVRVDLSAHTVIRADQRVHLTPTELKMIEFLARNAGALVTRATLLKEIWGSDDVTDSGYLRLYMSQLRKKLETDPAHPQHLLTEQGLGYRLELSPEEAPGA